MPTKKSQKDSAAANQKLRDAIEKKHGKSPEELFKEREKRLYDAVQMKVPDRVPVVFGGTFFACKYAGIPFSAAYYDAPAWKNAYAKMLIDLEPDGYGSGSRGIRVRPWRARIELHQVPGGNLPPDVGQQVLEAEFMKEDEYPLFLSDTSDFIVRYWLPRVYGTMQPLSQLPPLRSISTNIGPITTLFASPEFAKFATAMAKAGQEEEKWRDAMGNLDQEMASFGFPQALPARGGVQPPFSGFTNNFRTFRGSVLDMHRQPDNFEAALEKILEYNIARATPAVRRPGRPTIGNSGEMHRVSDEILSPKQFQTFVWPNWKRAIQKTLDLGYDIISMFFEGRRDKQLEYFLEFPKGSMFIRFAETDIFRAKDILGDRACIMGNVPIMMLQMGSPRKLKSTARS